MRILNFVFSVTLFKTLHNISSWNWVLRIIQHCGVPGWLKCLYTLEEYNKFHLTKPWAVSIGTHSWILYDENINFDRESVFHVLFQPFESYQQRVQDAFGGCRDNLLQNKQIKHSQTWRSTKFEIGKNCLLCPFYFSSEASLTAAGESTF